MYIDSSGNVVKSYEYILECIATWIEIDRNNVYGYTFYNYYIDFSSLSSIKNAIAEIIEKLSLECEIKDIKQNLSKVIVNLEYNGESFDLSIGYSQ